MILTVTTNAALDRVIFISRYLPGETMRATNCLDSVGGKGLDSSVVLQALGVKNIALSFIAGERGQKLARLLDNYGIEKELVWVEGETRLAHVIVEVDYHRHQHIITQGYQVTATDLEAFVERYTGLLGKAKWVIIAGSLPVGAPGDFYSQLVRLARQQGVATLVDCPGEPARQAALARPEILKMNRDEFTNTFGGAAEPLAALITSANQVREQYGLVGLTITCGRDGILVLTPGDNYLAVPPVQTAINAAGAGDAVSACMAWQLAEGDGWGNALRWAAAASAAVVLTEGTADLRLADVHRLFDQIALETIGLVQAGE